MRHNHILDNVFWKSLYIIITFTLSMPQVQGAQPEDSPQALVGSWKLVSWQQKHSDGSIKYPLGKSPVGLLVYDNLGNISVQMMDDFRPVFEAGYEQTTLDELKSVYSSYMALFGRYAVNPEDKTIDISVKGITNPNYLSSDLTRYYQLDDDLLTLSLDKQGNNQTIWNRMSIQN